MKTRNCDRKNRRKLDFAANGNEMWRKAKDLRIKVLGCNCEICRDPIPYEKLKGHHVNGRHSDNPNHWKYCQLRCTDCERYLHRDLPDGNSKRSKRIQEENNKIIEKSLRDAHEILTYVMIFS